MSADRLEAQSGELQSRFGALLRLGLVILFAVAIATLATRTAIVGAYAQENPQLAAAFWGGHPDVLRSETLQTIARAQARSQAPPRTILSQMDALAKRAPLAPEPFLIKSAMAIEARRYSEAQQLLTAAVRREPRSVVGHLLLADVYLQRNLVEPALEEFAVLARLSPAASQSLLPALAQFAKTPGSLPQLRAALSTNPALASQLLAELASDPANARVVLDLASRWPQLKDAGPWQQKLLSSLVRVGDYDTAYTLWHTFDPNAGKRPEFGFYEPGLASPFTWVFANGAEASAEPVNGALKVAFTGNQGAVLATKIAHLAPGAYKMRSRVTSGFTDALEWNVNCLPGDTLLLSQSVGQSHSGLLLGTFRVSRACRAQRFQLEGVAQTIASPAEFSIDSVDVQRLSD